MRLLQTIKPPPGEDARPLSLWSLTLFVMAITTALLVLTTSLAVARTASAVPRPVQVPKIVFDTDVCNDVDDVLALAMLHSLQSRGNCELLAVTISTPDELAASFVEAVNTFYGRPGIPIGLTRARIKHEPSRYLHLAASVDEGKPRYPHAGKQGDAVPPPAAVLRKVLSAQPDQSVVIVQVGYFSNLAALLESSGDAECPLDGVELVRRKVRLLSTMAGTFGPGPRDFEFNVMQDQAAARTVARRWPTPVVWSGKEVGLALRYPASSIERDYGYVAHHPVAEAYNLFEPAPHHRPCWDLTSVLYAVFPDRGYFELSRPGMVTIEDDGHTRFDAQDGDPRVEARAAAEDGVVSVQGRDRYLGVDPAEIPRVVEAFVQLASQPPASVSRP